MILDIVIFIDFNAILPFFGGEGLVALTSQQLKPRKGFGEGFTGVHHGWRWAYLHQVVTMETIVVTMENFGGNTGKKNTTTEKHTRQLVFAT